MSKFIFKNFDKVIPANNFAKKGHKYLFQSRYSVTSPSFALPDDANIVKGHNYDIFELGLITYEISRQHLSNQQILSQVQASSDPKYDSFISELQDELSRQEQQLANFFDQFKLQIQTKNFDIPAQIISNYIYVSGNQGQLQSDFFKANILPILKAKLEFMSLQNLIDTLDSLVKAKLIDDKELLKNILKKIENKTFDGEFSRVYFSGWKINSYEEAKNQENSGKGLWSLYYSDVKNGAIGASYRHNLRIYKNDIFNKIYSFVVFGDANVIQDYQDNINKSEENLKLLNILEQLNKLAPDTKAVELVNQIKNRV